MSKENIIETDKVSVNYIDASTLSTFTRCPARYYFSRQKGFTLPERSNIAPDFGTCMHRALPYAYDSVELAYEEFLIAWRAMPYGEGDDKRNPMRAYAMLCDFNKVRNKVNCPYTIVKFDIAAITKDVISENELPFIIDIGADLPAAGRIDLPVKWRTSGEYWACDYKTSQEVSGRFFSCFDNSCQVILYTIALETLTNENVSGMIIEALRVSAKNAETQLKHVFVSDYQISMFLEYAKRKVEELLISCESGEWQKNLAMCSCYSSFGHPGSTCEYMPMCLASNWENLSRMYKANEPFHPFAMQEDEKKYQDNLNNVVDLPRFGEDVE